MGFHAQRSSSEKDDDLCALNDEGKESSLIKRPLCVKGAGGVADWGIVGRPKMPLKMTIPPSFSYENATSLCTKEAFIRSFTFDIKILKIERVLSVLPPSDLGRDAAVRSTVKIVRWTIFRNLGEQSMIATCGA